jgi:NAD-reducing hydrogenase small subunit
MSRTRKKKTRLATAWLGGCSGCHMSFLDLDERLLDLVKTAELVYSPLADRKGLPEGMDLILVEGAVANTDHLKLAEQIRSRSKIVVSFGDCAATGNVTSLRNRLDVEDLLATVYQEGPGKISQQDELLPLLLPKVLPLHQVIPVDVFIPGCPPDPERIWAAVTSLLEGSPVVLSEKMRRFG